MPWYAATDSDWEWEDDDELLIVQAPTSEQAGEALVRKVLESDADGVQLRVGEIVSRGLAAGTKNEQGEISIDEYIAFDRQVSMMEMRYIGALSMLARCYQSCRENTDLEYGIKRALQDGVEELPERFEIVSCSGGALAFEPIRK